MAVRAVVSDEKGTMETITLFEQHVADLLGDLDETAAAEDIALRLLVAPEAENKVDHRNIVVSLIKC